MIDKITTADKVAFRMRDMGYTVAQLAETTGLSEMIISRMISGNSAFTDERLEKIADALGCSAESLRGDDSEVIVKKPVKAPKTAPSVQTENVAPKVNKTGIDQIIELLRLVVENVDDETRGKYIEVIKLLRNM